MNPEMYAELDGSPQAARESRDLVRHMLGEDHPVADDAALVASELVSNAVIHTRSGQPGGMLILAVKVSEHPAAVCIRVRDAGTLGAPLLAAPGPGSEHGRGLAIIAALATEWGSEPSGSGRATWCRLTPDTSAAVPPGRKTSQQAGKPQPCDGQGQHDA